MSDVVTQCASSIIVKLDVQGVTNKVLRLAVGQKQAFPIHVKSV